MDSNDSFKKKFYHQKRYREAQVAGGCEQPENYQSHGSIVPVLSSLDGANYSRLHALNNKVYSLPFNQLVTLSFIHIQPDPYAPGSQLCVSVPLPEFLSVSTLLSAYSGTIESLDTASDLERDSYVELIRGHCRVAVEDFILRSLWDGLRMYHRSGNIQILKPSQHVLPRSSVSLTSDTILIFLRVKLPGQGRRIDSQACLRILLKELQPAIQEKVCVLDPHALQRHVASLLDQVWLRQQLHSNDLVAFVRDGAVLPRAAGDSDLPLEGAVPFKSPPTLSWTFKLPFSGTSITGMGLPKGITLITGGGFHGKSTLLRALELGVYNHIPNDGRTFVVIDPTGVKIRAEDRRSINGVDISLFINNLPFKKDTTAFATDDASGSTSQAANIIEAVELGSTAILLDEDTSATNFMYRDALMQQLVPRDLEPITPFVETVRGLFAQHGVSTIMVVGGSGQYFARADLVLMMNSYTVSDVTSRAKELSKAEEQLRVAGKQSEEEATDEKAMMRCGGRGYVDSAPLIKLPLKRHLEYGGTFNWTWRNNSRDFVKISGSGLNTIRLDDEIIHLDLVEQLVEEGQLNAIAQCLAMLRDDGAAAAEEIQSHPAPSYHGQGRGIPNNNSNNSRAQQMTPGLCYPSLIDSFLAFQPGDYSHISRLVFHCEWRLRNAALECQAKSCYLPRGFTTLPRVFEIGAALNRLRTLCTCRK
ncbi:unnamed protein product [Phytomonas sp. EM1]|nr:unnamed protein product [Phytomonas sp. EM1]|eukprot:CCW64367.1 unnamed protein product [Phytomonas sp. isolate EM1]